MRWRRSGLRGAKKGGGGGTAGAGGRARPMPAADPQVPSIAPPAPSPSAPPPAPMSFGALPAAARLSPQPRGELCQCPPTSDPQAQTCRSRIRCAPAVRRRSLKLEERDRSPCTHPNSLLPSIFCPLPLLLVRQRPARWSVGGEACVDEAGAAARRFPEALWATPLLLRRTVGGRHGQRRCR